jgi:hypothetical protein
MAGPPARTTSSHRRQWVDRRMRQGRPGVAAGPGGASDADADHRGRFGIRVDPRHARTRSSRVLHPRRHRPARGRPGCRRVRDRLGDGRRRRRLPALVETVLYSVSASVAGGVRHPAHAEPPAAGHTAQAGRLLGPSRRRPPHRRRGPPTRSCRRADLNMADRNLRGLRGGATSPRTGDLAPMRHFSHTRWGAWDGHDDRPAAAPRIRVAVTCGAVVLSYAQTWDRCRRLVAGLGRLGVGPGDRVAVIGPNCHRYLELYQAVPGGEWCWYR